MAIGADRSGHISAIVHEAHTETSRYNAYEDNVMTGPRFQYGCTEHAVDVSRCAA